MSPKRLNRRYLGSRKVFCSALPISYAPMPRDSWKPFASLVLEAAYEATLLAACACRDDGASSILLLTRLGGGAFGNDDHWIDAAIARALKRAEFAGLQILMVYRGSVPAAMIEFEHFWNRG